MLVREAKTIARQWVIEAAGTLPGFHGAYLAGSVNWLPDDAVLPATSDLDINVVFTGPHPPNQRGKFQYRDVLLEVTPLALEQVRLPDLILGHYHLAGGFRTPSILADPSGHLTEIQRVVSRDYAKRQWVRQRCGHARREVLNGLALDESGSFPDQVLGWLFATGRMTHVLLTAGLRNPTVRRRYVAARELLVEYGQPAFYETLLDLLGCAGMSRSQVEAHLATLAELFDIATAVIKTPFSFASDISNIARPLAMDGSRELITNGYHREAMFWIAVTYSRCQKVLAIDAALDLKARFDPGYQQLLGDLGVTSPADLWQRSELVRTHLADVWEVGEAIMAANPDIEEE
jgi:hypothetical protein